MFAHHTSEHLRFVRVLFLPNLFEIDLRRIIADVDVIWIFEVSEIGDLINLSFLELKLFEQIVPGEQMVLLKAFFFCLSDGSNRSATFLSEKSTGALLLIRHAKNVFRRALCFDEETRSLFGTVICQKSFVISLSMIDDSDLMNSRRSRVRNTFRSDSICDSGENEYRLVIDEKKNHFPM